jgi:hypothetical protein
MGVSQTGSIPKKRLSAETLAAFRTAAGENLTAIDRCHAGTEAMAAFANKLRGLICAFHGGTLLFFVF